MRKQRERERERERKKQGNREPLIRNMHISDVKKVGK